MKQRLGQLARHRAGAPLALHRRVPAGRGMLNHTPGVRNGRFLHAHLATVSRHTESVQVA
ncbi:hypothetical protein SDC9_135397 [bioreactor metagenome]|uniref:Uncharacterized protein n=1 Tax=bioreactor metagenome TaxID=1076179 RepID=A0A645DGF6_9ZZZZ